MENPGCQIFSTITNSIMFSFTGQKFALNEEKVVIANLVRRFRLTTDQTFENLSVLGELVLTSETGVFVDIQKRE